MTLKYRLSPVQQDVLVAFAETGPRSVRRLHDGWLKTWPPRPDIDRLRRAVLTLERHRLVERHYHTQYRHAYTLTAEGSAEAARIQGKVL